MSTNSRLKKSLKNAKVGALFFLFNLILQFLFRKILLEKLGIEVLGLNTTALNLLQFLNLAELGIGASVGYSLYKPLSNKDFTYVTEIISLQGYLYKRIGLIVLIAGIILSLFFPFIFSNMHLPLWYAYSTFGVLFLSALVGYFFNFHQILLVSDQKEFTLNYVSQGVKLFKLLLQILSIYYFNNGYIWWLFWELFALLATSYGINHLLKKEYPWLILNKSNGKVLLAKYPEIVFKTKQLITHKFAGFTLNETTPLIIFSFSNLTFIATYGNYVLIIAGVSGLLGAIFNSMNASIGNLVSEVNNTKVKVVFEELFTMRFYLAVVLCYCTYKLIPFLIIFWMGNQYLLDQSTLLLLVLLMFINLTRLTVDSFINAYGLFSDIAAPIIELVTNVTASILLGYFFGINGVLIGSILSLIFVVLLWKPHFLFSNGMKIKSKTYFSMYIKQFLVSVFVVFICEYALKIISIDPTISLVNFLIYSFLVFMAVSLLLLLMYLCFVDGMKLLIVRFKIQLNINGR